VQNQSSDLDVVCIIPDSLTGQEFVTKIYQHLSGLYQQARIITNAQVPILKLKIDDVPVDLLYARSSLFPFSIPLTVSAQKYFDETSWQTLVGCLEADILLTVVSQYVELENFREFLRAVRLWAKCRAILGNAWGFPGSFSWTILAAWSCNNLTNTKTKPVDLLANFFSRLSAYDWNEPIALTESGKKYKVNLPKDWLPIITSVKPNQNSARNISRSTSEIVKKEIALGAKILPKLQKGEIQWDKFFEIANLNEVAKKSLIINTTAKNTNDLEISLGWVEGHIFGLMLSLEQLSITLRPWPISKTQQKQGQFIIEIDTVLDESDAKLSEIIDSFTENFYKNCPKGAKITISYKH
jgi:poly(A) polymerase Pap1